MSGTRLRQLTGLRGVLLGILIAAYALVQSAGLIHATQHLNPDRAAPHPVVCLLCVAAVESGGAPLFEPPALAAAPLLHEAPVSEVMLQRSEITNPLYQSRAPPNAA